METRKLVYIYVAGPISHGDYGVNIRNGVEAATRLLEHGFIPYCPHLSAFHHIIFPQPYERWIELDFAWLEKCDALLRLDGYSPGADREIDHARARGIPVFNSLDTVLAVAHAIL